MTEPKQEKTWTVLGYFKYLNNEVFFEINEEETEVRVKHLEHPFSKHSQGETQEETETFKDECFIRKGKDKFNSLVYKLVYYVNTFEVSRYKQQN